jgi:asparagine N-glycosylation enzyme membrane subunit Stt3
MSNSTLNSPANSEKGYHPVFIALLILLFHGMIFFKFQDFVLHQITLRDFDGYWHLARATDLHNFGNTYHTIQTRSNAPYGESLHWTSAFDLLLYFGAYVGSFFADFNASLLWWSIIINPILHVLTFLVLFWGLRDLIGDLRASFFGVLFSFQLFYAAIFDIGVPDHHGAQIFLFSLFIALMIKSIINGNLKYFSICGIIGGLSLWFGIESIAFILIAFSFLGLLWVLDGNTYKSKNLLFSFMLLLTSFLTYYFDTRHDELMKTIYDRVSITHVFLFLTITIFWALVALMSKWTHLLAKKIGRLIVATTGALACIFLMLYFFPMFFNNPLSKVNSLIQLIYLNQTNEFTGLFSANNVHSEIAYAFWAMTLPAIPVSTFLCFRNSSKEERQAWIFITIVNIFYITLSALVFRAIIFTILCSLIPISYAFSHIFILISKKVIWPYNRIFRALFIVTCCVVFIAPGIIFKSKNPDYLINDKIFYLKHVNILTRTHISQQNLEES